MMPGFLSAWSGSAGPPVGWEEGLLFEIWRNLIQADRYMMLVRGLGITLQIAFFAVIMGTALGFVLALMNISRIKVLSAIATTYVSVIRGIPLVVQLLIMNFVILPPHTPRLLVCIITFGLNSGGYVAEIFRAGILSVDHGQTEAGRSVGLSSAQTMRLIIFPQAIKNALPPLVSEFIILFKDTSIVGFIGVQDITMIGNVIRSRTFSPFVPLITVALIYLVVVLTLTWLMGKLERRLRKSDTR
jgi:His/Glu/Gln/Arg/opine family amino acid ABC transporter permease subunit